MKTLITLIIIYLINLYSVAQVKFIVDDFEGLISTKESIGSHGLFTYGAVNYSVDQSLSTGKGYSGLRNFKINWNQKAAFGGWGKGIGMHVDLNAKTDYLNFYIYNPLSNKKKNEFKIILEDDDNNNGKFEPTKDDSWYAQVWVENKDDWQLISIPLSAFKDSNIGGDSKLNISHAHGKLLTAIVHMLHPETLSSKHHWYFDFLCFSNGKLNTGKSLFAPAEESVNRIKIGAWNDIGKKGDYTLIPHRFESYFRKKSERKLDVVHFFQPLSVSEGYLNSNVLSSSKLKELCDQGYIPMITLENMFVNAGENYRQPDLSNILSGHFDYLFNKWALTIKETEGLVYLRLLHEFNGDWYPWCIANNNQDPTLFVKTYRHIHTIFKKAGVENAKFIWCVNSISKPQASWNNILLAYPGDEYVDVVGMDVYNGAGNEVESIWRSFRMEATQNYYQLSSNFTKKEIFICEIASREGIAERGELGFHKAEWIEQMSEAIKTDLNKIQLISWFDESSTFKINSSPEVLEVFLSKLWLSAGQPKQME